MLAAAGLVLFLCWPLLAQAQSANDGYFPTLDGEVRVMELLPDGKLLIGGNFTSVNGITRQAMARLHADGSLDPDFNAQLGNGMVFAIAVQANGQILIGGNFTQVGVSQRNRIARLNPDGSLDGSFNPNASGSVRALVALSDGRILVGGFFQSIDGQTQRYLARLDATGSLDTGFDPDFTGSGVFALRVGPDGRILAGGLFWEIDGHSRPNVARLTRNGAVDPGFFANVPDIVYSVDIQRDGKVLIGGEFHQVNGTTRLRFARLMANGEIDFSMAGTHDFNHVVYSVRALMDGRILVSGLFTEVSGNHCVQVARIHFNGALDQCFHSSSTVSGGSAAAIDEQSDGKVVVGSFAITSGEYRLHRWDQLGSRDEQSHTSPNGPVSTVAVEPGGRILIGGQFTQTAECCFARNLARLVNLFANQQYEFTPDPDGQIFSISVQSDGKLLIGGYFSEINDQSRAFLVRLNADGSTDFQFNPAPDNTVMASLVQPDGKILVAGPFQNIGGAARNSLARLNANGSLDAAFDVPVDPGEFLDGQVLTMALQPDGRILIGGTFSLIGDQPRIGMARLMPDGSLDASFVPSGLSIAFVSGIHVQNNGRILYSGANSVGRLMANGSNDGSFTPVSIDSGGISSMMVTANGRILIAGLFSAVNGTARQHLARLNSNGSVDTSFLANVDGISLSALGLHADGRILAGGSFNGIAGNSFRDNFQRLSVPEAALQTLEISNGLVYWSLAGASPRPAMAPELQFSLNGVDFSTIATMQPTSDGWQVSGFEPPWQQIFYLRVRASIQHGYRGGSMGLMYSPVHQYYLIQDQIFGDRFSY